MRIVPDLSEIGAKVWDALAFPDANGSPFARHAFLSALESTACVSARTGWQSCHVTLWREETLVAATPLYRKSHSYGEYVFDWAWADAYERNGLTYYPKLLSAIPFTPVTGPRLMAADAEAREALVAALLAIARSTKVSSLHILYPIEEEAAALSEAGMMLRTGVQFHWTNANYTSFEQFLESLERKKRKNIRAERRKVAEQGIELRQVRGADTTDADWLFFSRCYDNTYREHHSSPYLSLAFFKEIAATMPENLLLIIASHEDRPIASSLVVHTPTTLYGRYWGALASVPCLHFECAYYQPLEFCIANGIQTFEGGAQGEHKMARGFLAGGDALSTLARTSCICQRNR